MKYFNDSNWLEAPEGSSPEQAVRFLAEAGAVSLDGRRRANAESGKRNLELREKAKSSSAEGNSKAGKAKGEGGRKDESKTRNEDNSESASTQGLVYVGAAYDAFQFLKSKEGIRCVYLNSSWRSFDPKQGWREVSDDFMIQEIVDFLVENQLKVDKNEVGKILLALTHFCRIRTQAEAFEPVYFLESAEGKIEAEEAPGWIACEDAVFHLPSIALALYRGEQLPEDKLLPIGPNLLIQGRIPCRLNPEAVCPKWDAFLENACPQDALTLQEMFGLSLTYDRSFNAFFVVYGPSGTGKSTCLNVLQRLNLGTVSQVSLGRFGERFFIYPLSRNRVNIVHDMDSIYEGDGSVSLREAVLKSVASGESLEIEQKHKNARTDYLRSLCVFGTNQLPRFADRSEAIGQRMRIIQFPNVFRGKEGQVRNLHESLFKELEGILIWALKGYGELLASGRNAISESTTAGELKASAIKDARPEIQFCEECLEKDEFSGYVPTLEIYQAYSRFCLARGYSPAGMSKAVPLIVAQMNVEAPKRVKLGGRLTSAIKGFSVVGKETF